MCRGEEEGYWMLTQGSHWRGGQIFDHGDKSKLNQGARET